MPRTDPFKGLRLSEQASDGQLDQRLFADPPPQAEPEREDTGSEPTEQSKPRPVKPEPPPPKPTSPEPVDLRPATLTRSRYDLAEHPLYKASFLFTQPELEALEDLKLELRRDLDAKVTKESVIRTALHMLLEDYATNGRRSYARKKIEKHTS